MKRRRSADKRFDDSLFDAAFQNKAVDNRCPVSDNLNRSSSNQPPETNIQYQITHHSQPTTRNPQRATHNAQFLGIVLIILMSALSGFSAYASVSNQDGYAFRAVIQKLSSLADRSTGTADNKAAADYIKAELSQLGFEIVDSQQFATPVKQYGTSSLSIPDRGVTIPIRPINSNAISPQKIAAPGLNGPLIYVGSGEFNELSGKTVENAIVLMEFESGRNWLSAADLGAKALIYLDRGNSPKIFFEEKFELSPIQFPRFWMPFDQAKELFPDFETMLLDPDDVRTIYLVGFDPNLYHEHAVASARNYGISRQAALRKMFRPFTDMVSRMS